jgi:RNA polymerase sigma-70 factor (ECF subfamily)
VRRRARDFPGYATETHALDTQALDRFLAGVERRALRIAEFGTGNREDALDIVQDTMLRLVQGYAQRPEQEWGPLFHRILQSRIADFHRREAVRRRWRTWFRSDEQVRGDPLENQPAPASTGPDRRSDAERMTATLEQALGGLPLRQQQAFLLRVWEGLNVAETAHAMGCSEGSVKTHLSRAMRALREQLEDHHW